MLQSGHSRGMEKLAGKSLKSRCVYPNTNSFYAATLSVLLADAVQKPGSRPGVALVLRGKEGTGKGFFVTEFGRLFGVHFLPVTNSKHLTGNFNAHLENKLLVFADEAFWAGDKQAEGVLKSMITEDTLLLERKGFDAIKVPECQYIASPCRASYRHTAASRDAGSRQGQQAFVNAVNLNIAGKLAEHLHHPAAEVAVQRVIVAENMDVMLAKLVFDFKIGHAEVKARRLRSLLFAITMPSLFDSTTTGLPFSFGWNTRSQEA